MSYYVLMGLEVEMDCLAFTFLTAWTSLMIFFIRKISFPFNFPVIRLMTIDFQMSASTAAPFLQLQDGPPFSY